MLCIHLGRCTTATSKNEIIATHVRKKKKEKKEMVSCADICNRNIFLEADSLGCNHRYKAQQKYQICLTIFGFIQVQLSWEKLQFHQCGREYSAHQRQLCTASCPARSFAAHQGDAQSSGSDCDCGILVDVCGALKGSSVCLAAESPSHHLCWMLELLEG